MRTTTHLWPILIVAASAVDLGGVVAQAIGGELQTVSSSLDQRMGSTIFFDKATAPDFETKDLHGNPVTIASFKGKVVVLDFWAAWCQPCRKALPHVQDLAKQYQDQGVMVLAVGTADTHSAFQKWMTANAKD
jgi:thiol-disulfide isomerase/thioredoxin